MTDYIPTTEELKSIWGETFIYEAVEDAYSGFDRWLAEVIRKAKEEAWDEGWVSETFVWNPYRHGEEQ